MRIAIYAFDGVTMFHLAAPQIVFETVARLGLADWTSTVISESPRVRTAEGWSLGDLEALEAAQEADVVVMPSWHSDPREVPAVTDMLRASHERGATILGLCLGAVPVAAAGLLDGRRAVTHWRAYPALGRIRPGVELDETALYVDHGDVLTSAGTAASLDACLHLVRRLLGTGPANAVARQLVMAPHRSGGQAQFIERPLPDADHDALGQALAWALAHLDEPLGVQDLARLAAMSPRTLVRAFRRRTGTTPAAWLREQRLRQAQRLLESTDMAIEQVAYASGLGSPVTMRQVFARSMGVTPSEYRRQFRGRRPRDRHSAAR